MGSKKVGNMEDHWPLSHRSKKGWQPSKKEYDKIMNRYKINKNARG